MIHPGFNLSGANHVEKKFRLSPESSLARSPSRWEGDIYPENKCDAVKKHRLTLVFGYFPYPHFLGEEVAA
jgi:hypothetical protein